MNPVARAQVYRFLAEAFLYPRDLWTEDLPLLAEILDRLGLPDGLRDVPVPPDLESLQSEHRRTFGATGSLTYETECGIPNEFQQSQELADIAGFYRAFGLQVGGEVRERPDHIAVELDFMHVVALKEAYALDRGLTEQAEVCLDAQRAFLRDHLARWIAPFAEAVSRLEAVVPGAPGPESLYPRLARLAQRFVLADAERLGIRPEERPLAGLRATPEPPDLDCEACPIAGSHGAAVEG